MIGLLAAATFIIAIVHQSAATRPIGEGEVFVADAERALRTMAGVEDPDEAVRMARNDLGIEAVSLVGPDGTIIVSTSGTLSGQTLTNPLFIYSSGEGRFAALATSVDQPIELDGVTEWPAFRASRTISAALKAAIPPPTMRRMRAIHPPLPAGTRRVERMGGSSVGLVAVGHAPHWSLRSGP